MTTRSTAPLLVLLWLAGCPAFSGSDAYRCDSDSDCPAGRSCDRLRSLCLAPGGDSDGGPDDGGAGGGVCPGGFDLAQTSLDFGTVEPGHTRVVPLVLTNPDATARCDLTGVDVLPGDPAVFRLVEAEDALAGLAPGQTIAVPVAYTPPTAGDHTGSLELQAAEGHQESILLVGSGGGRLLVSPDTIDFGTLPECRSPPRAVCVSNPTAGSIDVTFESLSDPRFEVSSPGTRSVGATGRTCVDVHFTPTGPGPAVATLGITTDREAYAVTLRGHAGVGGEVTETFSVPASLQADILLVIDDSGSMLPHQEALAAAAGDIIGAALALNIDYRIAIISTTLEYQGLFQSAGAHARVITPATQDGAWVLEQNVVLGEEGSSIEQGLESARLALTQPTLGEDHPQFLRPDAKLVLLFLTNEDDASDGGVAYYLDFFRGVHGASRPGRFVASSFEGRTSSSPCINPPSRYQDLVQATGGVTESLCQADWTRFVDDLIRPVAQPTRYFLSGGPEPSTLSVTVVPPGGAPLQPTVTYDPSANAVALDEAPPAGAEVRVSYQPRCL